MAEPSVPPRNLLFQTADHDRAGEFLTDLHGAGIRASGSKDGYFLRYTRRASTAFSIDTAHQTADAAFVTESMPMVIVAVTRDTVLDYRFAGAEYRFGPHEAFLCSRGDGEPYWVRWHNGTAQVAVIPDSLLAAVAATEEKRRQEPIRLTDSCPVDVASARQLAATLTYVDESLRDRPQAMAEPFVAGAAGRLLAAMVLTTFPNTAVTEPTIEDRHDAHERTLRRAMAFVDDHAAQDITVAEIAAAVNVSIRALQYAFRRHRGMTPMGYLRQVRLDQAHQELLAADPTTGVTITQIAARWGFFHAGRFAAYYRGVYGCPPYETLLRHGG